MDTKSGNTSISVSAIIAVYNPDLCFFEKAVASVLSQTISVRELVLVNDGGSESFRSILPDDGRIRVFSKKNEGVAATRNFALQQCSGEYIAFLDQDDYWYPDKLEEQMAMIPVPGEPCMVTSPVDIVVSNGSMLDKLSRRESEEYLWKTGQATAGLNLFEGNFIYSSTPLIHRAVFEKAGLFDPRTQPHDDWDIYLRIVLAGFSLYCYRERALSVWRSHEYNESNKLNAMMRSKCRVEKKLLKIVTDDVIRMLLATNLLIDFLERVNLLYKHGEYRRFRALVKIHLFRLLRYKYNFRGVAIELHKAYSDRIRKIVLKSTRRYLVSFFLS
jgi:glycosyltransferase involved in cell wall biosynthesis